MTRRALLLACLGLAAPRQASAAGVHVTGRLTATDQEQQEGYFGLCGASGACHPTDAIALSVHPKNAAVHGQLRAMVGRDVQVSIFTV